MQSQTQDKKNVTLGTIVKDTLKVGAEGIGTLVLGGVSISSAFGAVSVINYAGNYPSEEILALIITASISATAGAGVWLLGKKTTKDFRTFIEDISNYRDKDYPPLDNAVYSI